MSSVDPSSSPRGIGSRITEALRPAGNRLASAAMTPGPSPGRLLRLHNAPSLEDAVKGKVVLITGSSSGIGEVSAKRVAKAGAITLLVARRIEELERVAGEIRAEGGIAHTYPTDLADLDDVGRLAAEVLKDHGHVDILVNNAGRSIRRSVNQSVERMHDYERTMQINYFGPVKLVLELLPSMMERRSGHIINVATFGVQMEAMPMFAAYGGSKAALTVFTRSLRAEASRKDIDVTIVHPALVRTPMIAPTREWDNMASVSAETASDMIIEAIRTRPSRVAPALSSTLRVFDVFGSSVIDFSAKRGWLTR